MKNKIKELLNWGQHFIINFSCCFLTVVTLKLVPLLFPTLFFLKGVFSPIPPNCGNFVPSQFNIPQISSNISYWNTQAHWPCLIESRLVDIVSDTCHPAPCYLNRDKVFLLLSRDSNLCPQPSTVFEHCWRLKPLATTAGWRK